MGKQLIKYNPQNIESRIFSVRGVQVMLDYHLAELYQVETKRINEQVKRNINRFPDHYMFQLTEGEWSNLHSQITTAEQIENLQSQIATAKRRTLPYVFTEQGVGMLSAVLNSEIAVSISIQIMDAFVEMRKVLSSTPNLYQNNYNLIYKNTTVNTPRLWLKYSVNLMTV